MPRALSPGTNSRILQSWLEKCFGDDISTEFELHTEPHVRNVGAITGEEIPNCFAANGSEHDHATIKAYASGVSVNYTKN